MSEPRHLPFVTSDGQQLTLTHWPGSGPGPAVLLIHGFGQNLMTWHSRERSYAEHLAKQGYAVFGADLRGHGASRTTSRCAQSLADYVARDLPALLDVVSQHMEGRNLAILGHSLGGLLGASLALQYPDRVAGIGLVSSPGSVRLGRQFALARMLPTAKRYLPGFSLLERFPFRLDLIGLATAMTVAHAGEGMVRFPVAPWRRGSMEKTLLVDRLSSGFDVTGWGVVTELAQWGESGHLAIPGETNDLISDFGRLRLPVLLVDSPGDAIVPRRSAIAEAAFPEANVTRFRVDGFGHCDILLGTRAPQAVWPHLDRWLATLA